jgi:hypothetical protein
MGMSSTEWPRYMHQQLNVSLPPSKISAVVVKQVSEHFARDLPARGQARPVGHIASRSEVGALA